MAGPSASVSFPELLPPRISIANSTPQMLPRISTDIAMLGARDCLDLPIAGRRQSVNSDAPMGQSQSFARPNSYHTDNVDTMKNSNSPDGTERKFS